MDVTLLVIDVLNALVLVAIFVVLFVVWRKVMKDSMSPGVTIRLVDSRTAIIKVRAPEEEGPRRVFLRVLERLPHDSNELLGMLQQLSEHGSDDTLEVTRSLEQNGNPPGRPASPSRDQEREPCVTEGKSNS